MGRPREFDEDDVIDGAIHAFWRHGYAATSILQLLNATEIERGSLYKAFGDKRSLFLRALDRYLEHGRESMGQTLDDARSPLVGIEQWLKNVATGCSGAGTPPGCLAVNAMVEMASGDAEVRARLVRHWALVGRRLAATLALGQSTGEVRPDVPPQQLADCVTRLVIGIAVFARQGDHADLAPTILATLRSP